METKENIDIYFSLFAGTFIILLFAVAIIVFFVLYRKRIFEKQLQLEKKESEHRLELLKTIIATTEQERKRIAGDLHDEIGSHLTTVRMSINAIKTKAQAQPDLLLIANEGKSTLDNAINSVRTISHNLLPPGLETFGFVNTVSDLCNTLSNTSGISIVFTSNQPATRFNTTAELALYRIVQELLTNSLKHANAKNINITFEQKNANILLEYVDDGVGFSVETKDSKKGLGLKNMESRIMALNGILDISTKPDSGFKASLTIPLI